MNTYKQVQIKQIFHNAIEQRIFPGAYFAFVGDGKEMHESFGTTVYDGGEPVSNKTLFDIASITKMVTSTAVLQLIEQNRFKLNEPIVNIIPNITKEPFSKITVWHLLTHTSGIHIQLSSLSSEELHCLIEETLGKKAVFETSNRTIEYANINTLLLGRVIECVSGMTLDEFVTKNILKPLTMSNTGYYPRKGECSIAPTEVLAGIVHDESARAMSYPVGHAGLFSTGTDLEYFMQAWIKGGAILQEETIKKSITTQVQGNDLAMGLGWHIDELKYLGHKTPAGTFLHPGFTGTLIGGSKEYDFYFVILTNSVYPKRQDPEKKNHFFRSLFDIIFE